MARQSNHSNTTYRLITSLWLILFTLLLLLSGCAQEPGDNTTTGNSADTTVASIKINPGGLMFTHTGDSQTLSATAYNAAGDELDVTDFTWETSKPDSVSVDTGGTATAQTPLGSATITAHADGVTSTPLLITIAQPVPGAVLVNDAQVVGDIRPHDSAEALTLGSLYDVTLTGLTPPEIGEILISTGKATVGGRVVEVREENGQTIVTLEFVGLDELFTAFTINETLPIPAGDIDINPELEADYDITTNPDGSLTFTPKQADLSVTGAVGQAVGTSVRSMGPFECGTDLSVFPLGLSAAPTFTLTRIFDYTVILEDSYKKVAVTGTLTIERTDSWALTSSLTGKVTCEIEIASLRLPIPAGLLALFFSGRVPVGLGLEAGGQVSLTGLGFEMKAKTGGDVEAGFEVSDSGGFRFLSSYTETDNSFETKWTPPPSGIASGLRLSPSLTGYAFANLDIGLNLYRSPRFQVLGAKLGLNMTGNLALVDGQIEDTTYASDYKLSLDASIGPGSGITGFLNRLRMNLSGAGMSLSVPLFESPKAAEITADVESFLAGDTVNFNVKLDPAMIEFLGIYNVFEVQIYRRKTDSFGDVSGEFIGAATAANDQTEFDISWTASDDGDINDEFYAYVVTKFLPFPYFESLELGVVIPTTEEKITFVSGNFGEQTIYAMDTTGANLTTLLENIAIMGVQAISPDGTKIAFIQYDLSEAAEPGIGGIYTIDVNNATLVRLTASNSERNLSWSPDGRKIVFSRRDGSSTDISTHIYSVNADGSNQTRLTEGRSDSSPQWSPDGTKIVFERDRDGTTEIHVMNTDGSNQTRLTFARTDTDTSEWDIRPHWSPDSTKIAFMRYRDSTYEIYVMNADGSNQRQLTSNTVKDYLLQGKSWSPDGTKIAFMRYRDNTYKIYVMNADGSDQTRLAITPSNQRCAEWSPDGTKIAFTDRATGMYIINADGSNLSPINGTNACPGWIK